MRGAEFFSPDRDGGSAPSIREEPVIRWSTDRRLDVAITLSWLAGAYFWVRPIVDADGCGIFGLYMPGEFVRAFGATAAGLILFSIRRAEASERLRRSFRWFAAGVSLVLAWSAAEWTFHRWGPPWKAEPALTPVFDFTEAYNVSDPELGYRHKPGFHWEGMAFDHPSAHRVDWRIDENGFRNRSLPDRAEFLLLGDSFAEAPNMPEEKTFIQRLAAITGKPAVNLGRSYSGPCEQSITLHRYGERFRPAIVVWQLFEGNDVLDALLFLRNGPKPPAVVKEESNPAWSPERSLIRRLLGLLWVDKGLDSTGLWGTFQTDDGEEVGIQMDYPYRPWPDPRSEPAEWEGAWTEVVRRFEEIVRWCREHEARLVLLHLPIKLRAFGPACRFEESDLPRLGELRAGGGWDDHTGLATRLDALCRETPEVLYLDATPPLREAAKRGELIYSRVFDTHLDVAGHEVVAREILKILE